MSPQGSCASLQSLLGVYALDAVDAEETTAVVDHLRSCPRCRAEVADFREAAARMAHGGGEAPQAVWERVQAALDDTDAPPFERVMGIAPPRRRQRFVRIVTSIAAVLAIGVLGARVVSDGRRIDRLAPVSERDALVLAANRALVDPQAQRVTLRASDGAASADAVVLRDGTGYLVHTDLPALGAAETYQLWALMGTSKISAGVLGARPQLSAFRVVGDVWGLAITKERAGGAVNASSATVVVGSLKQESPPSTSST